MQAQLFYSFRTTPWKPLKDKNWSWNIWQFYESGCVSTASAGTRMALAWSSQFCAFVHCSQLQYCWHLWCKWLGKMSLWIICSISPCRREVRKNSDLRSKYIYSKDCRQLTSWVFSGISEPGRQGCQKLDALVTLSARCQKAPCLSRCLIGVELFVSQSFSSFSWNPDTFGFVVRWRNLES